MRIKKGSPFFKTQIILVYTFDFFLVCEIKINQIDGIYTPIKVHIYFFFLFCV